MSDPVIYLLALATFYALLAGSFALIMHWVSTRGPPRERPMPWWKALWDCW